MLLAFDKDPCLPPSHSQSGSLRMGGATWTTPLLEVVVVSRLVAQISYTCRRFFFSRKIPSGFQAPLSNVKKAFFPICTLYIFPFLLYDFFGHAVLTLIALA